MKKGKMERKRRKILKGRGEKMENGRGNGMRMSRGTFFFFCMSLFKTTKIFLGLLKWAILTEKNHISRRGKNQEN